MKTIKGPALFLAQFAGDAAPYNSLDAICAWAASLGYEGVQIPSWDGRLFDLNKAAESKTYCDEVKGTPARALGVADVAAPVVARGAHLIGGRAGRRRGSGGTQSRCRREARQTRSSLLVSVR